MGSSVARLISRPEALRKTVTANPRINRVHAPSMRFPVRALEDSDAERVDIGHRSPGRASGLSAASFHVQSSGCLRGCPEILGDRGRGATIPSSSGGGCGALAVGPGVARFSCDGRPDPSTRLRRPAYDEYSSGSRSFEPPIRSSHGQPRTLLSQPSCCPMTQCPWGRSGGRSSIPR